MKKNKTKSLVTIFMLAIFTLQFNVPTKASQ